MIKIENASSFICSKTLQNVHFALIIMQTNIKLLEIQGLLIIRCGFNFGNNINQRNLISREQCYHQLIVIVGIFLNNESLSFIYMIRLLRLLKLKIDYCKLNLIMIPIWV